ncbi:MAG: M48 family metallopeptidase [Gammaproteobacteria bacterium]|nr:M48 family metallopeptidase [Gammaproteobacteria bacterium]MCW8986889.1 M48 family metallopeptidase [Gammaproteobacteria bacterium]MCW9030900.1 M48 family metallopeptidase [Gammaproteobacteria bacterium]
MDYSNPELPEGINTSKEHPLKEFFILTAGILALVFIVISTLILLVDNFADKIPFELENELPVTSIIKYEQAEKLPPYLEKVTHKVLKSFELPEEIKITFHYVNDDTVNAFATLGGHIVLYRGLIEKLKHEEELAMVIAHEIAHIKYRHPIMSASHGIVVGIVLTALNSTSGNSIVSDLMGTTGTATLMKFSRDFEYQADKDAINSLIKLYGHAEGALGLFKVFEEEQGNQLNFEFLATHPLTDNRISQTTRMINANPNKQSHTMRAYPDSFKEWLKIQKEKTDESK